MKSAAESLTKPLDVKAALVTPATNRLRPYAAQGGVVVTPTADLSAVTPITYTTGQAHWELLLRARAVENQCHVLAIGQGGLTSKLIRVGHLGWVSDKDISEVMTALKTVMPRFWKS